MTILAEEALDGERLRHALGNGAGRLAILERQRLKLGVHRLRLEWNGAPRSVIAKRIAPEIAVRNRLVVERWLPAEAMQDTAAPVLGVVGEPAATWLVSEDLGMETLEGEAAADPARVDAAVTLIARLHRTFADHAVLGECRMWGGDLGASFLTSNLRDAFRAVAAVRKRLAGDGERAALCERLLARLRGLQEEAPRRAEALERWGGPETLLHGDLWLENFVAVQRDAGLELRLIDWDHAAAGPPIYDVSTFLYRFDPSVRGRLWAAYCRAYGERTWRFPAEPELALLCEACEHARIANRVIWPALAALRGEDEDFAFSELATVAGWFEELRPLLP